MSVFQSGDECEKRKVLGGRYFNGKNLQIVVDLSICGARTRNYLPSPLYNGLSAVESAVHQMAAAGVQVVRRVEWKKNKPKGCRSIP